MPNLAARMLRHRPGSAVATLLALAIGAMILTAMGVLVESGLHHRPEPRHYAAADLVIAHRDLTVTGKDFDGEEIRSTVPLGEGGTVDATLADRVRALPGVTSAVAEQAIPVVPVAAPVATKGYGWASAALTPYKLIKGAEPASAGDVVVDARLGANPGDRLDLLVDGVSRQFRVSGVVTGDAAAVFFTDERAAGLAPRPGRADAVGVFLAPGADRAAIEKLAAGAGAEVYAGDDRGRAESSAETTMSGLLITIGASFGGYVVLLVVFVVAGTVGLSVRHRRRDLALLRAVAATPGQVRRMVTAEATLISVLAAALGVPAGLAAARWVHGELVDRGFLSASFPMVPGFFSALAVAVLTVVVAVLAALLAVRRISGIRPVEALGEIAVEPGRGGKVRLVSGLLALAAAAGSISATAFLTGEAALTGAIGMLYLFVTAVALLAPWINVAAARLLAPLFRRVWGPSGHLATANLRATAKGGATVLTALVLSVGFGGSVWFLQDNMQRATLEQSRAGLLADHVLTSPAGLSAGTVSKLDKQDGVNAATGLLHTSVVLRIFGGEAESVGALAVDPAGAAKTLDLGGSLAGLDKNSVAVSRMRAGTQGWETGDTIELWLGDGTPIKLRVAGIYERGLGFGDIVLDRDTVRGHTSHNASDEVLVDGDPGPAADDDGKSLIAVSPAAARTGQLESDLALSAWLNKLLVGVMVGYAALAAANSMVMAALARRRELALLRIVGVTRRQARRMVNAEQTGLLGVALVLGGGIAAITLTAVVHALTGDALPRIPPIGGIIILAGATLLALGTTILPINRLLHVPPVEHLGLKE